MASSRNYSILQPSGQNSDWAASDAAFVWRDLPGREMRASAAFVDAASRTVVVESACIDEEKAACFPDLILESRKRSAASPWTPHNRMQVHQDTSFDCALASPGMEPQGDWQQLPDQDELAYDPVVSVAVGVAAGTVALEIVVYFEAL